MTGVHQLLIVLLYGSGLRLREALQLRIKDFDFSQRQIIIRDAKGGERRVTMLPKRAIHPLKQHLDIIKKRHQDDLNQAQSRGPRLVQSFGYLILRGNDNRD
jgi:integrase